MLEGKRVLLISCLLIFLLALLRYWIPYDPADTVPHDPESFRLARSLVDTGTFSNPFVALDTGPSAHLAPAFPAFLAQMIRLFGDKSVGIYAIRLAAILVLCIQLAFFPIFSEVLGMGRLNGFVSALIWIASKVGTATLPNQTSVVMFGWESFYVSFLLALAALVFRHYLNLPPESRTRLAWLLGSIFGLLLLASPTVATVFAGWFVWLAWKDRQAIFKSSALLLVLLPLLFLTPWLVRNYLVFHRVFFVRDNFGLELAVSNNDCAHFGIQQNLVNGCFFKEHPNLNVEEAQKVLANGEVQYNKQRLSEARKWISDHPSRFAELCLQRFVAFWAPKESEGLRAFVARGHRLERAVIYLLTLLTLPGIFLLYKKDQQSSIICGVCLLLFPLVYYLVQYEYRYRYPILWITFLLGSFPVSSLLQRAKNSIVLPHVS